MPSDILLIGAGAAGLLAARTLARAGHPVTILEARSRIGGRVHTFTDHGFSAPTEAGAEFMHGETPLTQALLREAGMASHATAGRAYEVRHGYARQTEEFIENMPLLLEKLWELPQDIPLAEFLTRYFPSPAHNQLRASVTQFAEGYDAADPQRASTFALRDEWSAGGAEDSPRPAGGYGALLALLARQSQAAGATLHLATTVQEVRWQPGKVEVRCDQNRHFRAQQALVTVPLGVLQVPAGQPGHLRIAPELPAHRAAAAALGFGSVIKVLLEFDAAFWATAPSSLTRPMPALGFLFSDAAVPTWWSQLPAQRPLLTGWLAGPAADRLRAAPDEHLLHSALDSVAYLFGTSAEVVRQHLRAHYVANWGADPLARGAYAYATVGGATAQQQLRQPVASTLFFAGEALYEGPAVGTVEAALVSGAQAAEHIARLAQHK